MLIQVTGGAVASGPNQRFNPDPQAEAFVVTAAANRAPSASRASSSRVIARACAVWDGNPEVLELDPDKPRPAEPDCITGGLERSTPTGVLGYEFGDYEIWPSSLTVTPAPLPVAVLAARWRTSSPPATLNLFRLFDDVDDPGTEDDGQVVSSAEYARRLTKFSLYIRTVMDSPDILAVSEVESQSSPPGRWRTRS